MLLESCGFFFLVSAPLKWVTFCDLISSPKLCSSTLSPVSSPVHKVQEEDGGRELGSMTELTASQDADCVFVYMFGLLILSSGL